MYLGDKLNCMMETIIKKSLVIPFWPEYQERSKLWAQESRDTSSFSHFLNSVSCSKVNPVTELQHCSAEVAQVPKDWRKTPIPVQRRGVLLCKLCRLPNISSISSLYTLPQGQVQIYENAQHLGKLKHWEKWHLFVWRIQNKKKQVLEKSYRGMSWETSFCMNQKMSWTSPKCSCAEQTHKPKPSLKSEQLYKWLP